MNATIPEGRRTAATFVAATGAFLLVAASALFVAVRWDQLSDAAKLGILSAVTGCALAGGRALQKELPATGNVIFHLGAFLVPVTAAAAMLRLDVDWRVFLWVEAAASTAAFAGLAALSRSGVLRAAAAGGVVALSVGVAAVSPLPAGVVLAAVAAGALASGERRLATAWGATAGLAPVAAAGCAALFAAAGGELGLGVLAELGLAASQPSAVVAGVVAAGVLAHAARTTGNLAVAFLALASLAATSLVSWLSLVDRGSVDAVAAAVTFLAIEVAALLATRDALWRRLAAPVAITVEVVVAAITLPSMAIAVLLAPLADEGLDFFSDAPGWVPEPVLGAAAAITAIAWAAAALRMTAPREALLRQAARAVLGAPVTVLPLALSITAAVAVGTASPLATAWTAAAVGVALASTRRIVAAIVAAGLGFWCGVLGYDPLGWSAAMMTSVAVLWLAAVVADGDRARVGNITRATFLLPLFVATTLTAGEAFLLCAAVALFLAADAWRFADQRLGVAAVLGLQAPIALGAHLAGFDQPGIGLVMCAIAVVAAGLGTLSWPRWQAATATGVVAPLVLGLSFTSVEASAFGTALLIAGGVAFVAALVTLETWLGHLGGALVIAGTWMHLGVADVRASEAYIAPVALHLVVLGWQLRRRAAVDSWAAYGPAVALLGGAAIAERIDGGGAWHAVLAGAIGVLAVSAGGWFRLIAPLILGGAILVTVVLHESLATLATVPTWAWLALGGVTLLGVGVSLERSGTSPVEAGRRVADVLATRFE